jgi:hypothetical protein
MTKREKKLEGALAEVMAFPLIQPGIYLVDTPVGQVLEGAVAALGYRPTVGQRSWIRSEGRWKEAA